MRKRFILNLILSCVLCWTVAAQTAEENIRPGIQHIVSRLKKEAILHLGSLVGIAGIPETKNKYYKLYRKLNTKATNHELVLLTKDKSKTIVLYSFLILHARNYIGLKEIFIANMNDRSEVWMAGGCTGSVDKVNSFMLRQLNPDYMDSGKPYLTKMEYIDYMKLINKEDTID